MFLFLFWDHRKLAKMGLIFYKFDTYLLFPKLHKNIYNLLSYHRDVGVPFNKTAFTLDTFCSKSALIQVIRIQVAETKRMPKLSFFKNWKQEYSYTLLKDYTSINSSLKQFLHI